MTICVQIENVSKSFGGVAALEDCSFVVRSGVITALIGPNGSGKSTLFHILSRLVLEDEGRVLFEHRDLKALADFEVARLGVARTFQEVRLFRYLTIRDHLEIALREDDEGCIQSVFGLKRDYTKKMHEVLTLVGLFKPLTTIVTELSYGQRKLLDLAMALAKKHTILLLDEPVAGVNPQLRGEIKKILRELRERGETILLIEHDMNFVMDLADEVIVLDAGKVIAKGGPVEIQRNEKVLEAYLGER